MRFVRSNEIYAIIVQSVFAIKFDPQLCVIHSCFSRFFAGHDSTPGSGQEGLKMTWVGSSRVRSGGVRNVTDPVGSGPVNKFSNLAGRAGSAQEVFKSNGSGRTGSRGLKSHRSGWVGS